MRPEERENQTCDRDQGSRYIYLIDVGGCLVHDHSSNAGSKQTENLEEETQEFDNVVVKDALEGHPTCPLGVSGKDIIVRYCRIGPPPDITLLCAATETGAFPIAADPVTSSEGKYS